ncbi:MAG: PspC domain-containing protein [Shewanella sp.]|nr:PspC domain-containing protein [Shewanella sp.]
MSMKQWELRFKKSPKMICGVAAEIAHRFSWSPLWTRVVWIGCCFAAPLLTAVAYLVLAQFMPQRR